MSVHCPFEFITVIDGQVRDKQALQFITLTVAVTLTARGLG
jgi:hypothetical protein